jgi:hypothetical protein
MATGFDVLGPSDDGAEPLTCGLGAELGVRSTPIGAGSAEPVDADVDVAGKGAEVTAEVVLTAQPLMKAGTTMQQATAKPTSRLARPRFRGIVGTPSL